MKLKCSECGLKILSFPIASAPFGKDRIFVPLIYLLFSEKINNVQQVFNQAILLFNFTTEV